MPDLYIGLMSGTSLDGVDGVLCDFSSDHIRVLAHAACGLGAPLRAELLALNTSGNDELHRGAMAANALMHHYAAVVRELLDRTGTPASDVVALGAHGQTVRHRPQAFGGTGYTLQLANPALLAELTGVTVVADFRSRDVAAGGQGAPLAPFFHEAFFGDDRQTVGVLNLGGIANLTVLRPGQPVAGFDCGPGNALMDAWCHRHTGAPYDDAGRWAASGQVLPDLLAGLLADPYFAAAPPKSTGRDLFNAGWLDRHLLAHAHADAADVQATLAELTARACANDAARHATGLQRLVVCGGGALNDHLMQRLAALLPGAHIVSSAECGLPPLQVEATAFAWLARKCLRGEKLALKNTTGAQGARVLGAVYPA